MRFLLFVILPLTSAIASPMPFPVFLKAGFSTILEFEDVPTKVVLGDSNAFQLEKLDHSLVIKTNSPYATTNMFVYFKNKEPRLFVVTASEDAEPTYYKKFEDPKPIPKTAPTSKIVVSKSSAAVTKTTFDSKKDYLSVETIIAADSTSPIIPKWDLVRLSYKGSTITPFKLWSERREIQKDSRVRSRFVFVKPNIPRTLKDVTLIIPVQGKANPFLLTFVVRPR